MSSYVNTVASTDDVLGKILANRVPGGALSGTSKLGYTGTDGVCATFVELMFNAYKLIITPP